MKAPKSLTFKKLNPIYSSLMDHVMLDSIGSDATMMNKRTAATVLPPTLRPVGKRVLLDPIPPDKMIGSLHIPEQFDQSKSQPQCGVVLAIGDKARCKCDKPDCDALLPGVEVGDVVAFHRFEGQQINHLDRAYILVEARFVLCKVPS
jgi:co-chaperonin GroES (HSP10)